MKVGSKGATRRQWIVRATGSGVLLAVILWLLPTGELWNAVQRVPINLWLAVVGLFLIGHVINALKWWILALRGSDVSFVMALRGHFSGLAANLCLPGIAGGDVVRAALVMNKTNDKPRLAVGSLADRLIDSAALLLLASVGAVWLTESRGGAPAPLAKIALLLGGAIIVLVIVIAILSKVLPQDLAKKLAVAAVECARRPGSLLSCLCLSISVQAGFIVLTMMFSSAVGLDVETAVWFFAWPLAKLLALLPISISGLGVREAGLAALMWPFGANPAAVVAVGLIWQTVLFAAGLIGALVLMLPSLGTGSPLESLRAGQSAAESRKPKQVSAENAPPAPKISWRT